MNIERLRRRAAHFTLVLALATGASGAALIGFTATGLTIDDPIIKSLALFACVTTGLTIVGSVLILALQTRAHRKADDFLVTNEKLPWPHRDPADIIFDSPATPYQPIVYADPLPHSYPLLTDGQLASEIHRLKTALRDGYGFEPVARLKAYALSLDYAEEEWARRHASDNVIPFRPS